MFSLFVESRVGNSNRARVRIHTEDRESVVKYVYIYIEVIPGKLREKNQA